LSSEEKEYYEKALAEVFIGGKDKHEYYR